MTNMIIPKPLILSVYLPAFIMSLGRGMLIPVLPLYAKSFDVSYSYVGLVLAADGIGTILGDVPAGLLIRRLGRKTVMVLGVGCVAGSLVALFSAQTILEAAGYRLLAGIGNALWNISRLAYLADSTTPFQRGRSIALFGGVSRIGTFAGPAIGGIVGAHFSLRAPFLFYAGLAAATIVTSILFVEKSESDVKGSLANKAESHLINVLKTHYRVLSSAGMGQMMAQMVRNGRHIIVPLYAADILGLDVQSVGWIVSIASFVDMSLFYPAGLVMDRYGRKYTSVPSFAVQALGMAMIPLSGGFIGLMLASSLIGFGNGIGSGAMMTLGTDLAPKESTAEFLGVWRLIGDGGHMGGPLAVGNIADLFGLNSATFMIAGTGVLASAIFAFLVPETLQKPPSGESNSN